MGRFANRIAQGRFVLDGREHVLACNDGPNHLHGGEVGYSHRVWTVEEEGRIVGLAMVREFDEEPLGYELQQLMIDRREQGRGVGSAALALVLERLRAEGSWPTVEVCVKRADGPALRVYEKAGFTDTGYVDPEAPDAFNLVCTL